MVIKLIPRIEFERVGRAVTGDQGKLLPIIGDMCRINTLTAIKIAGSGHIGSSFSAMDLYVWALYKELNTVRLGTNNKDRDILFSSKGHDVPALYSVYFALGIVTEEQLLRLRRHQGLPGHPDVSNSFIEANSGSLGMGISKARGRAWSKHYRGDGGRVFVLVGDGELQEGQNYEALQNTAASTSSEINILVDHNKIQTDKRVDEISFLGSLEDRFQSFGWRVERCNGHNYEAMSEAYDCVRKGESRLNVLIADTIKGKGVSFMEAGSDPPFDGVYEWHAGSPNDTQYEDAYRELLTRIDNGLTSLGLDKINPHAINKKWKRECDQQEVFGEQMSTVRRQSIEVSGKEFLVETFGKELVRHGSARKDIVIFDADLAADLGLRKFSKAFPKRFVEVGIAEQDMVSMAGAVARDGFSANRELIRRLLIVKSQRADLQQRDRENKNHLYLPLRWHYPSWTWEVAPKR